MTTDAKRQMGLYLVEHMEVIEDVTWHEAVEAYVAMRDQRDRARAIAVQFEQECAMLRREVDTILRRWRQCDEIRSSS